MKFRVLSSDVVYRGRVINLRVDVIEVDGKGIRKEVVEHRGAAAIVPLTDRGEVILIRQYRDAIGERIVEIPAGTIEEGENPEECARRELEEETGLKPKSLCKLASFYLTPGYSNEILHLFMAEVGEGRGQRLSMDESIEIITRSLEDSVKMIERGEIRDAKTIIGLLLVSRELSRRV